MKILLLFLLPLILSAEILELKGLRTDLYSKVGANTLKKIELSLEFEGSNLKNNTSKLYDSTLSVISGFFYEDIFTEIGKNNFKETLKRFISKKHRLEIKEIYILSVSGVEKFDLEEFKRFLQDADIKGDSKEQLRKEIESIEKNISVQTPNVPQIPDLSNLLGEENNENLNIDNIDTSILELPKIPEKTPIQLKDKNTTGFSIETDDKNTSGF
ncbi:hypothetical protein DMB92_05630 [Campylobacter sp. MIT 99-7217]|nr:hypothetical protein [Campylobacter sp. MIT 99-7217]TQR31867.1 hypothetical protein DMB92_05630 [Campylobacter sp. MIT 99-7217]